MLRKSFVLALLMLYVLAGLVSVISAHERAMPHCLWANGNEFGHHYAEMTQNSSLARDHNLSQHPHYSGCAP